jgi:adhesin transport system membrane fusion protein
MIRLSRLKIRRIRLEVEMAGLFEFSVPELIIQNSPEIFRSENALLRARQMDYVNRREGANRVMDEAMREKKLYEDMLKKRCCRRGRSDPRAQGGHRCPSGL